MSHIVIEVAVVDGDCEEAELTREVQKAKGGKK